jgi:hypothetical protein
VPRASTAAHDRLIASVNRPDAVLRGLAAYDRRNPRAPRVAVGDMGRRHGGHPHPHAAARDAVAAP